ncbi:hypothetical protein M5C99_13550 [Acidovorax sp. NCPPB 2350]|nr:hypothetical protein M5C99_13550 [Acidovorax sp. NCPPB 2350]
MWFKIKKETLFHPEEVIHSHSLKHLAEVFGVPEASLALDARFGEELKADPASDFKANQFDIIDGDIKDVADKQLLKEMEQGKLIIRTVHDYCQYMIKCSRINPKKVALVLGLPKVE